MTKIDLAEKRQQILDSEREMARQLALQVFEKPVPPIWMIFIPIFFVFHGWKLKQYTAGLNTFVDNYLVSRRLALDASIEAEQTGEAVDLHSLLEHAGDIPGPARPLFLEWMGLLTTHYRSLLAARGPSHAALVRTCYHNKSNYLLFCNRLNHMEHAFNLAILPQIKGDATDLSDVIAKMNQGSTELRRQEGEAIFA
jgi:hypothetical protein